MIKKIKAILDKRLDWGIWETIVLIVSIALIFCLLFYAYNVAIAGGDLEQLDYSVASQLSQSASQGNRVTAHQTHQNIGDLIRGFNGQFSVELKASGYASGFYPSFCTSTNCESGVTFWPGRDWVVSAEFNPTTKDWLIIIDSELWRAAYPATGWYGLTLGWGGQINYFTYGSADPNSFPNGSFFWRDNFGGYVADANVKDMFFEYTFALDYAFDFVFPQDTQVLAADFDRWEFGFDIFEADTYGIYVFAERGGDIASDYSKAYLEPGSYLYSILKSKILGIGEWNAFSILWIDATQEELAEDSITFTITGIIPPGEPETGEPYDPAICDDPEYTWIEKALCVVNEKVLRALFVPTPESINRYNNLWPAIQKKPPLGIFSAFKIAFEDLEQEKSFDLDIGEAFDPVFQPLRSGFTAVLWVLFGVWSVKRIASLEL